MVMSKAAVVELARDSLIPGLQQERQNLNNIDDWYRWSPSKVRVPAHADLEEQYLRDLAETPWLNLVVTTVAQQLVAELLRSSERDTTALWLPWQRNRMQSRQRAIHRAALAYGYAYTTVTPGDTGAVIRGRSPRDMYAVYGDPVMDEYPLYFLIAKGGGLYTVTDEEMVYSLGVENGKLVYITEDAHGAGVAPGVRYSNQIDLEGRTPGEVEPFIPLAKRINKTTFDRLLIQHHSSWKVRTATGLDDPTDDADNEKRKLLLRQNDILTGGEGVQFGTLDETAPDGLIKAGETDIETLAAVSQTPAHALTGKMINLSADAITEARAMLDLKAGERKVGFGDSHVQTLRLAAHIEGRDDDASDFSLVVDWADLGSRSMNQAADALGKLAASLGIPQEKLWDRIPGVTPDLADSWLKYKQANPTPDEQLASALRGQANGADTSGAAAN